MLCVQFDGVYGMRFESLSDKRPQQGRTEEGSGTTFVLGGYIQ